MTINLFDLKIIEEWRKLKERYKEEGIKEEKIYIEIGEQYGMPSRVIKYWLNRKRKKTYHMETIKRLGGPGASHMHVYYMDKIIPGMFSDENEELTLPDITDRIRAITGVPYHPSQVEKKMESERHPSIPVEKKGDKYKLTPDK